MEAAACRAAKMQVVEHMLQGQPWHEPVAAAGLRISRSTAYQLLKRVRTEGEAALIDGRHGHPPKLRAPLRHRLEEFWRAHQEGVSRSPLQRLRLLPDAPRGVPPRCGCAGGSWHF